MALLSLMLCYNEKLGYLLHFTKTVILKLQAFPVWMCPRKTKENFFATQTAVETFWSNRVLDEKFDWSIWLKLKSFLNKQKLFRQPESDCRICSHLKTRWERLFNIVQKKMYRLQWYIAKNVQKAVEGFNS